MKRAGWLVLAAAAVIAIDAWLLAVTWHLPYGTGLYCATGTASTVGCDPSLPGLAQVVTVAVMLTSIPLLAMVFALVTAHHAGKRAGEHVAAAEATLTREADQRHVIMQRHVERLLAGHCADLKEHINAATGGQREDPR